MSDLTTRREVLLKQVANNIRVAQEKQKATYNRKHANPSRFEVCCVCVFYGLVLEPPLITKFLDPPLKCLHLKVTLERVLFPREPARWFQSREDQWCTP